MNFMNKQLVNACHMQQSLIIVIDEISEPEDFDVKLLKNKIVFVEISTALLPKVLFCFNFL